MGLVEVIDTPAEIVEVLTVVLTTVSTSGFVAAWFNRKSRRERAIDLKARAQEVDKMAADAASVALQSLRAELDAASGDMEKRRAQLVAQELIIERQARELVEARKELSRHETTIHTMSEWCHWVTTTLEGQGIEIPAPMKAVIARIDAPREPSV